MARKTLKSSYVLGFYQVWTKENSRKEIFEDLQNLLETRAEALSKVRRHCKNAGTKQRQTPESAGRFSGAS